MELDVPHAQQVLAAGFEPAPHDPAKRGRVALAIAAVVLKFGLFLALLGALFWRVPVEGMSFACGVTLLLVACLIEVGHSDSRMRNGAG